MRQIAVFGSAFNPPTRGHLDVIRQLTHFDEILLVPSIAHAWGKQMFAYTYRCQLVEHFILDINKEHDWASKVQLSTIEQDLYHSQAVTTFDVLTALESQYPSASLSFIIGPDNMLSFDQFHRFEEILQRWCIMTCPQRISTRSTQVRAILSQTQNLFEKENSLLKLTTPQVTNLLLDYAN